MFILICTLSILFIPSLADAWGPATHIYLGHQVLDLGMSAIPSGIYTLIKKHKQDFLYGNLSADIIIGKSFQRFGRNSHSWEVAWELFKAAKTKPQTAFAYGYLTHLCADTVVHNLSKSRFPFKHSFLEIRSDCIVGRKYRSSLKGFDKMMQRRNDVLMETILESVLFSFKTNKRIFKGFLMLSKPRNYTPVFNFIDNRLPYEIPVADIENFQQESLNRMFELLSKGMDSKVLQEHPLGRYKRKLFQRVRKPASC